MQTIANQTAGSGQDIVDFDTVQATFPRPDYLRIGGNNFGSYITVLRFTIPTSFLDKKITSAFLKFYCVIDSPLLSTGKDYYIAFVDADDATVQTTHSNILGVTIGPSILQHINYPGLLKGDSVLTGDITAALAPVLYRSGFSANNHVVLYLISRYHEGGVITGSDESYDGTSIPGGPFTKPKLIINWDYVVPGDNIIANHVYANLTFDQLINVVSFRQDKMAMLTIEQTIVVELQRGRLVEHTLTIDQTIAYQKEIIVNVNSDVFIDQDIGHSRIWNKSVEDVILIEQDITKQSNKSRQVISEIIVDQDIVHGREFNVDVIQQLTIEQTVGQTPKQINVVHTLTITQEFDVETQLQGAKGVNDTLVVDQTILVNTVRTRAFEDEVTITQVIIGYFQTTLPNGALVVSTERITTLNRPDTNYTPITSTVTPSTLPPTIDVSEGVITSSLLLEYPVSSPTATVTLPSPIFGNREEIQVTRVQRKTLDDDLKVFSDADWPRVRTFRYQFEDVNDALLADYETFLLLSLGLEIKLTDYEGRVWRGFIITPGLDSTDTDRGTCDNTIGFEFTGVEV